MAIIVSSEAIRGVATCVVIPVTEFGRASDAPVPVINTVNSGRGTNDRGCGRQAREVLRRRVKVVAALEGQRPPPDRAAGRAFGPGYTDARRCPTSRRRGSHRVAPRGP